MGNIFLTPDEYRKLVDELDYLLITGRDEMAERIKAARTLGDLSENIEYNDAMNAQARMEARIVKIERDLPQVTIVTGMDPGIFTWAKTFSSALPVIEKISINKLDTYVEKIGRHLSVYHNDETGETLKCVFYEKEAKLFWTEITNFNEMVKENPEIVKLWLRNGECLCTYISKGKNLKIVNMSFMDKI